MFNSSEITDFSDIQIIDFGLAKESINEFGLLSTIVGSPYFTAPEVHEGIYGKECDVWSCGVVLYVLLSGNYPYNASTVSLLYEKIQRKEPEFPYCDWEHISSDAEDLLVRMLDRSPKTRITFEECLKHKWFKKFHDSDKPTRDSTKGKLLARCISNRQSRIPRDL